MKLICTYSFIPKDKILEVLKLDQFLTLTNEDMDEHFLKFKANVYPVMKSLFALDSGEPYFDSY
jgi:ATP binding cassette subfamily A (ABC1) protein 13